MNDERVPGQTAPRLLRFALLGSVGLNLFFAGLWVGGAVRPPPPGGPLHELGRRLQGKLSADGMSKVDGLLQQIHSGFRRQFEQTESVRRQLHSILVTEPFDADAFSRTLEALNANRTRFDSDMSQDIVAAVRALSPDDRRILADAVLSLPPGPLG